MKENRCIQCRGFFFGAGYLKSMEGNREAISIRELDRSNYPEFRSELTALYLHAFTTGEYAQYIASETVEATLDGIMQDGSGRMAFAGERLVGLLAAFPLKREPDFPVDRCPDIPVEQAIYIAEVMVHADYRGRGIASQIVESYLHRKPEKYSHAVIRVWEENRPALNLYRKLGFAPVAGVSQRKLNVEGEEFVMRKIYLLKLLL